MAGKQFAAALEKIDRSTEHSPDNAIKLVKEAAFAKFDETVELHVRLGIDPRHSDQQLRTTVSLPHGLGKTVRVLVFAEGEAARAAQDAGAEYIADDEIITKIDKDGWVEFDIAIATPDMMPKVGRLGKVLGRRGLMPNPKAGTVVQAEDLPRAIEEARAGRIEFRNDKAGNVHIPVGKVSFSEEHLRGNLSALMEAIVRNRPPGAKGRYLRRVVLTSSMGPGIRVDPAAAETMFVV